MTSTHPRVLVGDSLQTGPPAWACPLAGAIFHPPYFGTAPMSDNENDLSWVDDEDVYRTSLKKAADIVVENLSHNGMVCAVGRRYRHDGEEIRLDEWFVEIFSDTLVVEEVWLSIPDVAIIMRKED